MNKDINQIAKDIVGQILIKRSVKINSHLLMMNLIEKYKLDKDERTDCLEFIGIEITEKLTLLILEHQEASGLTLKEAVEQTLLEYGMLSNNLLEYYSTQAHRNHLRSCK